MAIRAPAKGGRGVSDPTSDEFTRLFGAPIDIFSEPTGPCSDGGRDDPYWQTPTGARLMAQMEETSAAMAVDKERRRIAEAAALAQRLAQEEAKEAEVREQHRARRELEASKRLERERLERAEQDARIEAKEAQRAAKAEERALAIEARDRRDPDFHAVRMGLWFHIEGAQADGEAIYSDYDPAGWMLHEDEGANERLIDKLKAEVMEAMAPWLSHFASLGAIRADDIEDSLLGEERAVHAEPCFYLVHPTDAADLEPARLGEFNEVSFDLKTVPGATLTLESCTRPVNATLLYEAAREGVAVGWCGGQETPDLVSAVAEERGEWLGRLCLSQERLARLTERWRRSGGNPALFAAAGAAGGDANKDRPIEFILPGLIPRGYVTLLAGTKQAGKSTLLGEILAVIDSECQEARFVLGTEVTARGVSCMVSGEDGMDFISCRNAYYEPVHGPGQGFAFDTAERPWAEVLQLLYAIPRVDIIGIDGLRAVMPGNEDSSEAISKFFDDLNALARYHRCAIVLVHHLSKSQVRSLSAMLPAVRGSGAITDRVRVAIGMIDRGSLVTEVGIIKHNIPPSETLWGETNVGRYFRRDAATLTLLPVETTTRGTGERSTDESVLETVIEAIAHFNRLGVVLRQTGKRELFEQRLPQLTGLSRGMMREGVTALLAAGQVADGPDGLKIAPHAHLAASA